MKLSPQRRIAALSVPLLLAGVLTACGDDQAVAPEPDVSNQTPDDGQDPNPAPQPDPDTDPDNTNGGTSDETSPSPDTSTATNVTAENAEFTYLPEGWEDLSTDDISGAVTYGDLMNGDNVTLYHIENTGGVSTTSEYQEQLDLQGTFGDFSPAQSTTINGETVEGIQAHTDFDGTMMHQILFIYFNPDGSALELVWTSADDIEPEQLSTFEEVTDGIVFTD